VQSARDAIVIDGLDPLQTAPLVDAGTTSYHGVKRVLGKLVPGSTVLVIGAGGLGSYAVQYLRLLSAARIVVIDRSPGRLRYAQDLGAHDVLEGCTEVTRALIRDMTGGHGVQAVLDFVGTDETIAFGLSLAAWMSSFALIGAGNGTITTPLFHSLPRDGELFCFQGGTLAETREVLDLARSGVLRLDVEIFPFSQTAKAYEQMYAGQLRGRAVVCPNSWE
jgi:propanol-preferring alcohol dehydrogenase